MAKTVLITSDTIGEEGELGLLLMKNFVYSLARSEVKPARVLLMNTAVHLSCKGSESLGDLESLVGAGVAVRSCGTCLDYLGLREALAVGEVGTMPDAVDVLLSDDAVITIS